MSVVEVDQSALFCITRRQKCDKLERNLKKSLNIIQVFMLN